MKPIRQFRQPLGAIVPNVGPKAAPAPNPAPQLDLPGVTPRLGADARA
jgi:hypothetical protein